MARYTLSTPARGQMLLSSRRAVLGGLGAALAMSGCSPLGALDALTPAGEYAVERDIRFGTRPRQALDLYRPLPTAPTSRAVVVFFYGGGWRSGDKEGYRFVAETLTRRGLTVVIPDYRLHPDVTFPAFIEDGSMAVRWVADHLLDGNRPVYLVGHSAGAYIAAMLALDPRYLRAVGMEPDRLTGVAGLAGPYDFLPLRSRRLEAIFTNAGALEQTQPITFARPGAPPMLLLSGDADVIVRAENSRRLAQRLGALGNRAELVIYPQLGHIPIVLGLSSSFGGDGRVLADVLRFVDGEKA